MKSRLIFVVALACGWMLHVQPAAACSYPSPGWYFQTDKGLVGAAGFPLFIEAISYGYPEGGYPELEADITVLGDDGNEVAGSSTLEVNAGDGLIRWNPEAPFETGQTFTVSIDSPDYEGPIEATLEVVPFEAPTFPARSPAVHEVETPKTYECCQVEDGRNGFCLEDSCGDFPWGEKCRDCRVVEYDYPIRLSLSGSDRPTIQPEPSQETFQKYYDLRLMEVVDDELVEIDTSPDGSVALGALDGERCFREEYAPLHESLESLLAPEFCVNPEDVETVERKSPDPTFEAGHCLVGTHTRGNFVDGFEESEPSANSESGDKEKSDGGCSATGAPTHGGALVVFLVGLAIRRRT